jgi:pimeloyl-ACP methyl ester carboxylesterase
MVLLHGSASNSATWAHDVIEYSEHFRAYAVDIPGEPGKSAESRFSWDGPAFSEWLGDVLDGLGVEKVILVGMSLGGWAAIRYALDQPDRVEEAVLICPAGICQPRPSFVVRAVGLSLLGDWGLDRMKRYVFQDAALTEEADLFFTLVAKHLRYRAGAPPLFSDEELGGLTMPVLYLAGEKDVLLDTQKSAERLQQTAPDVTVVLFEQDGHAAINKAGPVVAFLDDRVPV